MLNRQLSRFAEWIGWGDSHLCRFGAAVTIAAWLGILFGWLEALQHFLFRHNPDVLTIAKVSPDIFWVAPLVTVGLTVSLAIVAALPALIRPSWPTVAPAALLSTWLGVYGLATLTNSIHKGAAALLAAGVAVSLWRIFRQARARTFVGRTLPIFASALLLIPLGLVASDSWRERRWLDGLGPASPTARNVLLIVMDTTRADHLSLYGYGRDTSPHIDRWAANGVVFDNAWSTTSWTLPSHASLLTGRPTFEHGADRGARFDNRFPVLPELLRRHGYVTGAFIGNTIWLTPEYGFDRGFQRYSVHTPYADAVRTVWGRKLYSTLIEERNIRSLTVRKDAARINADLLQWVDSHPGRPFFAFLNYFDVHDPYQPPPPFDTKYTGDVPDARDQKKRYRRQINGYDGLVAYVDEQLGVLRRELERRDLARNTIIILTADHGEALGDHNEPQHGRNLHRPVLRVPLVVIDPAGSSPGRHVNNAVSIEQVPATVAALLGLQHDSPFTGDSLVQPVERVEGEPVLAELKRIGGALAAKSLIASRWQYIWNARDGSEELYDLERDPQEINNLAKNAETDAIRLEFRRRLRTIFPDLIASETRSSAIATVGGSVERR